MLWDALAQILTDIWQDNFSEVKTMKAGFYFIKFFLQKSGQQLSYTIKIWDQSGCSRFVWDSPAQYLTILWQNEFYEVKTSFHCFYFIKFILQ